MKTPPKARQAWRKLRRQTEEQKAVLESTKVVPEPVATAQDAPSLPPPEPAPVMNVVMAGSVHVNYTHKVTLAITAKSPGPNFLMLGITEARLLAKSLMEWAQYAEDRNNGKAQ